MPLFDLQQMLDALEHAPSEEVVNTLQTVTTRMPMHLPAYVLLGRALERQGAWTDALQVWERARFLMPNSPVVDAGIHRAMRHQHEGDEDASADAASTSALPEPLAQSFTPRPDAAGPSSMPASPLSSEAPALDPDEDLDRLIQELESARIRPDPDLDAVPEPDLDDDIEDMVSETLARIYTSQEQYHEAARVYIKLATQEPARSEEFLEKAAEMQARAEEQQEE